MIIVKPLAFNLTIVAFSIIFSSSVFAACTTNINLGGKKVTNLFDTLATDNTDVAATKYYVDKKIPVTGGHFAINGIGTYHMNYPCGMSGILAAKMAPINGGIWSSVAIVSTAIANNTADRLEVVSKYQFWNNAISADLEPAPGNNTTATVGPNEACGRVRLKVTRLDASSSLSWRFTGSAKDFP